jgi:hypothetical protein
MPHVTVEELDARFKMHSPDRGTCAAMVDFREACRLTADVICNLCPDGREQSLALTHLEEVMFWTNAGMARGGVKVR